MSWATLRARGGALRPPTKAEATTVAANVTANSAAALTNHFSCCRSTPCERRKRRIIETAEATKQNGKRNKPTVPTRSRMLLVASIPNGFASAMPGVSLSGPGKKARERPEKAIAATASHATTRQRSEGRRPFGNSRTRNVPIKPTEGTHIHSPSQAASFAPGSEPGWDRSA